MSPYITRRVLSPFPLSSASPPPHPPSTIAWPYISQHSVCHQTSCKTVLTRSQLDKIPSLFRSRAASFTEAQAAYNRIYNLGVVTRSARDIGAAAAFWALM